MKVGEPLLPISSWETLLCRGSYRLASPVTRPLLLDQVQPWWRAGERDLPAGAGWWGAGGLLRPALVQQTQARASEHHHQVGEKQTHSPDFQHKKYHFWISAKSSIAAKKYGYHCKKVSPLKSFASKKYRLKQRTALKKYRLK
jgi:hypothetical protein